MRSGQQRTNPCAPRRLNSKPHDEEQAARRLLLLHLSSAPAEESRHTGTTHMTAERLRVAVIGAAVAVAGGVLLLARLDAQVPQREALRETGSSVTGAFE